MPTYVTLVKFTDQGIRTIKDLPARFQAAGEVIQSMGGRIIAGYGTLGDYDMVVVTEGPNDESATAAALAIASRGNIRTATLRAFTMPEFAEILKKIP
jgi:uncharacterized protein with GYD domain